MITITKGEALKDLPNMLVYSESGDYEETDLIECASIDSPKLPVAAYQAQFVKFGNVVYHQQQPLTFDQVAALEINAPVDDVINNQDLIDGKISHLDLAPDEPKSAATKPRVPRTSDGTTPAVGDIVGPSVEETTTETSTELISE
jgi:hypothetical protein